MADLAFTIKEWLTATDEAPEFALSIGRLEIRIGDTVLTRHEDTWTGSVADAVLVSAYPLALWLVWHWWRLSFEPLPPERRPTPSWPPLDWRMAHELGAADHGYVWPRILFASDGEAIQVWAETFTMPGQSVQYLTGLSEPCSVPIDVFQDRVAHFVQTVLDRLADVGQHRTELATAWMRVDRERRDPETERRRRLEALLGFDPDQCPTDLLAELIRWEERVGPAAVDELAPAFGPRNEMITREIAALEEAKGVSVTPQVDPIDGKTSPIPWQQGVAAARALRQRIGNPDQPIATEALFDLVGLSRKAEVELDAVAQKGRPVALMRPMTTREFIFLPRKHHPIARRFELARLLGDWMTVASTGEWRVVSEMGTVRQKRQRAFAAEFLCPIEALTQFLGDDLSESAIDEASEHYAVSDWTVRSQLANNGYLPRFEPYQLCW